MRSVLEPRTHTATEPAHPQTRVEARASARAEARLAPIVVAIGWSVVALAALLQASAPGLVERYALWPLLLGIVFVGLPHGALDHLVPARMGLAWGRRPLPLAGFLAAYVGAALAYVGLWLLSPVAAFVGFLVITVGHWGQGDQQFLERFLNRRRGGPWASLLTIVTRGALPIVVPILAFPADADDLLQRATAALGLSVPTGSLADPTLHVTLTLLLVVASIAYVGTALRLARDARSGWIDVAEVVGLAAFFAFVPAYAAIGAYFLAWHSLRHLARLLLLRPADAESVRVGRVARPVGRLARDLTPITVAAIALLAGSALWARDHLTSAGDFVALYLVMISALTVPHAVVVAMMDAGTDAREARASSA